LNRAVFQEVQHQPKIIMEDSNALDFEQDAMPQVPG
jgi:hypothetical protein